MPHAISPSSAELITYELVSDRVINPPATIAPPPPPAPPAPAPAPPSPPPTVYVEDAPRSVLG